MNRRDGQVNGNGDVYHVSGQNIGSNIGRGNTIVNQGAMSASSALTQSISDARAQAQALPDGESRTEFLEALEDLERDVQAQAPKDKLERRLTRLRQWGESLNLGLTVLKVAEALKTWLG